MSSHVTASSAHGSGPRKPLRERFRAGAAHFAGSVLRPHPSLRLRPPKAARIIAQIWESECAKETVAGVFLLVPARCLLKRRSENSATRSPGDWYTAPSVRDTPKVLLSLRPDREVIALTVRPSSFLSEIGCCHVPPATVPLPYTLTVPSEPESAAAPKAAAIR